MNTHKPARMLAIGAALALAFGLAHAQVQWHFSGFGTLGLVHSDNRNADFAASVFQPNGAGLTQSTSFAPDTKLAGQIDATFTPQWSAVLQVISQHRYDNGYTPEIEWANVKYQATPELSLRAGRIPGPFLMLSDTRMVGYAQPWVRPPVEVYGTMRTRNDGADVVWRRRFGSVDNTLQAFAGQTSVDVPGAKARSKRQWGLNDSAQFGDVTLRAGYYRGTVDIEYGTLNALVAGLGMFTALPAPIGPQAAALAEKYNPNGQTLDTFTLGANYDPGQWFVMAEVLAIHNHRQGSVMPDSQAWYVNGGYRFGAFTPYATYSRVRNDTFVEAGLPVPQAAPLNAGLNAIAGNSTAQSTASMGLRWDFRKNMALKFQYDHVKLGANSSGSFVNVQPAFERGGSVNLLSAALDFVF